MLSLQEGRTAVALARQSLETYLLDRSRLTPRDLPAVFEEKLGVFVTLHQNGDLRGCIGYPYPVLPLGQAIVDSAINAGTGDPRFPPVRKDELGQIEIEVTVLTRPEVIGSDKEQLPDAVKIGRHGLIVRKGPFSGLLLPQVATEWGFDPVDFLCQTCIKAGLPVNAWLDVDTEVECFEAQIFSEQGPEGQVVEKELACKCD